MQVAAETRISESQGNATLTERKGIPERGLGAARPLPMGGKEELRDAQEGPRPGQRGEAGAAGGHTQADAGPCAAGGWGHWDGDSFTLNILSSLDLLRNAGIAFSFNRRISMAPTVQYNRHNNLNDTT